MGLWMEKIPSWTTEGIDPGCHQYGGIFLSLLAAFNECIYEPDRPINGLDAGHV